MTRTEGARGEAGEVKGDAMPDYLLIEMHRRRLEEAEQPSGSGARQEWFRWVREARRARRTR